MFVDIEIIGAESDCCKMKTTTVRKCECTSAPDNGWTTDNFQAN